MCRVLADNDVVAKAASYDLFEEFVAALSVDKTEIGILGTLRYVISPKRLKAAKDGGTRAYSRAMDFVSQVHVIEPNTEESRLAAQLEQEALERGVQLDIGESQLCAIAISRNCEKLCTGDKRAISAIEALRSSFQELMSLDHKVLSFEAVIREILRKFDHDGVRHRICGSIGTDKAIEICFHCYSAVGDPAETEQGLTSYLLRLRSDAPNACCEL